MPPSYKTGEKGWWLSNTALWGIVSTLRHSSQISRLTRWSGLITIWEILRPSSLLKNRRKIRREGRRKSKLWGDCPSRRMKGHSWSMSKISRRLFQMRAEQSMWEIRLSSSQVPIKFLTSCESISLTWKSLVKLSEFLVFDNWGNLARSILICLQVSASLFFLHFYPFTPTTKSKIVKKSSVNSPNLLNAIRKLEPTILKSFGLIFPIQNAKNN